MSNSPETPEHEALIVALIRRASDRLQRQLDDVRRHAESAHDQTGKLQNKRVQKRARAQKKQHG
jgi:hypothetical protein